MERSGQLVLLNGRLAAFATFKKDTFKPWSTGEIYAVYSPRKVLARASDNFGHEFDFTIETKEGIMVLFVMVRQLIT